MGRLDAGFAEALAYYNRRLSRSWEPRLPSSQKSLKEMGVLHFGASFECLIFLTMVMGIALTDPVE